MTSAPHSDHRAPARRLRHALVAVLLGTTMLAGTAAVAVPSQAVPPQSVTAAAETGVLPSSLAPLAERVSPAVVTISATRTVMDAEGAAPRRLPFPPGSPFEEFFRDFGGPDGPGQPEQGPRGGTSVGSGFIIDGAGHVVTNNHVVEGGQDIKVTLHDGTELPATVVGRDAKTDLALLKVASDKDLPHLAFGDSDKARVGDWVVAIGNPFGLGGTVTTGVVSARGRNINAGPYDDFIQTDAAINRGNSGGPMFNLNGEVIGINTAIFSPSGGSVGIGFAIPSNIARTVIDQLKEFGRTKRGWLGVRIQGVTPEIAESLGLPAPKGALVASVTPNGPAAKAGIQAGDVVTKFDGKEINEMRRLPRVVAETAIEKAVPVEVWRKGKSQTVQVKVGELEAAEESGLLANVPEEQTAPKAPAPKATEALGLKLTGITPELRQQFELKAEQRGVLVTEVASGSPASEKGVRAGDVIVEVGQEEVKSPADVTAKVQKAREQGKKSILLLVERQGDLRFVALPLGQG